ncbi:MAG: RcpC/CpaB family pilus assembly protein [Nocardioidaceae bacterium]|nr:RcpC/CpaB family pilus assembly protein [Nocardioidaceae bacterium]
MTRRQIVAAALAVVLAVGGIVSLIGYTRGAEARAFEGTEMTPVLRVVSGVPSGTAAAKIGTRVERVEMPATAVVEGAIDDLAAVAGRVTTTTLEPGEQVLASRFAAPETQKKADPTDVPVGFQEITVDLSLQRSVAKALDPGDVVGVIAGYGQQKAAASQSGFALQMVLVTAVRTPAALAAAEEPVLVTLAVKGNDAVKVAHAEEFGWIILTKQNDETDTSGPRTITSKDVLP